MTKAKRHDVAHSAVLVEQMYDITNPRHPVEVQVSVDRKTLWVNINGICVLRVCGINEIRLDALERHLRHRSKRIIVNKGDSDAS